ncbi:MAG: 16S rRNA (cytosine(1402)-N(4))-methyltransferase, partial [Aeromicrobium sp.]
LSVGGRVVVLSYHSLEDRITKRVITSATTSTAPRDLPVVPESMLARFRSLTRGAELASEDEIADNPRARSVRMRAVERIAPA